MPKLIWTEAEAGNVIRRTYDDKHEELEQEEFKRLVHEFMVAVNYEETRIVTPHDRVNVIDVFTWDTSPQGSDFWGSVFSLGPPQWGLIDA